MKSKRRRTNAEISKAKKKQYHQSEIIWLRETVKLLTEENRDLHTRKAFLEEDLKEARGGLDAEQYFKLRQAYMLRFEAEQAAKRKRK